MNLPQWSVPTDNLYKFIALSGVSITLLGIYLLSNQIGSSHSFSQGVNTQPCLFTQTTLIITLSSFFPLIILISGVILSILGFILWYIKVQRLQDIITENESNKCKNERSLTIHQSQFLKEFQIYNELWPALNGLKIEIDFIFGRLQEYEKLNDEEINFRKKEIEESSIRFGLKFDTVNIIYNNNKPFYPAEIFDNLEKVIDLSLRLFVEAKNIEKLAYVHTFLGIYRDQKMLFDEIIQNIDCVCGTIRNRIELPYH
jgi:hypothetical protein